MASPSFTQVAFRIRNDDNDEANATWRQAINTGDSVPVDTKFRVRFRIDEGNSAAWTSVNWTLYYSKNGAGYAAVTASTPVKFALSDNFADGADCTTQLSGGTGTFVTDNNGMKETTGGATNSGTKNYLFETEWCLTLDSTQLAQGNTIDLEIYNGTSPIATYSQVPRVTATFVVALTSKNIATPVPTVSKPTATHIHNLTSKNIATSVPTVGKPTIGQIHALTAKNIATPVPTVDKPTIVNVPPGVTVDLTAKDMASGVPTVEKPTIGQAHALTAKDIATPVPTVGKPDLVEVEPDALASKDITAGVPTISKPTLADSAPIPVVIPTVTTGGRRYFWSAEELYRSDDEVILLAIMELL